MKYSTTIALFVGLVAAGDDCQPCTDSLCIKNQNDYGVGDNGCHTTAPLSGTSSLPSLAAHFIGNRDNGSVQNVGTDYAIGFGENGARHHKIIDDDASSVKAHYESCHVGERIIPAIKEESHIQQAANYASDSASQYVIKGTANNNYNLKGSLSQTTGKVYKGADKHLSSLSLHGNLQKKYCQHGNCDLGCGCHCGDKQGLSTHLLDEKASEVTSDPEKRVNEEVNKAIRGAISKSISQALQYCIDESIGQAINV